jgi:hypothetical protein
MGLTEFMRFEGSHLDIVEFCREGDEGSTATLILQDTAYLEWDAVFRAIDAAPRISVEDFVAVAVEIFG